MDTQQLKAFTTVARLHSFTDAAEQLHLTQPAISKRIALLEDHLHCRLFDRIGRKVTLTEAGHALLPKAINILQSVADTERTISNLAGEVSGNLKIATSHHIGLHHLPKVLKPFTRQFPQVQLELDFIDSEKAFDAIRRGDIELAIVTLPGEPLSDFHIEHLWHDPLSFVVATDHPLASLEQPTLADLSGYAAILPDQSTHTTRVVTELFNRNQQNLNTSMATNYLETIKMMVSIGLGWSALPDTLIDHQLSVLKVANAEISRELGGVYHRQRTLSNAAKSFLEELLKNRGCSEVPSP